uniref:chorismate mutase n=1 Tax=Streptomyces sp. E5N298 TaxID=1851983 RepID=UPI00187D25C5
MAVRAVRGAVQLERDEAGHMDEQVAALLTALMERNGLTVADLISLWFPATPSLPLPFPAPPSPPLRLPPLPPFFSPALAL